MKQKITAIDWRDALGKYFLFLILMAFNSWSLQAQPGDCVFKDTLFSIDFGNAKAPQEFNLRSPGTYDRSYNDCPEDGYYSFSSRTSECFYGDWITLTADHTPNDIDGKMLLVNANPRASVFFNIKLKGFKANTKYEFGVWMMNLCKINGGCTPLPPDILITLEKADGKKVASFQTGKVSSSANPTWKKYFAFFTTPPDGTALNLRMEDMTNGGCGNDFTMDDITFRECYLKEMIQPVAEVKPERKPEVKPVTVAPKPVVKEPSQEQLKKDPVTVNRLPVKDSSGALKNVTKIKPVNIPLPQVILARENPVIRSIRTEATTMLVELYDNGQIDGDTVSIYHNNELVVSHAGLSEKPISFKIKIDKNDPHHELTMVADNLGSIPPNTSLMVITADKKRYEIFISSSEQKNARIVIDLEK